MSHDFDFTSVTPTSSGERNPIGGANSHQSTQWIMHELNRLSGLVAALDANHKFTSETTKQTHEKIGSFEASFYSKTEKYDVQLGSVTLNMQTIQHDQRHAADNFCKLDTRVESLNTKLDSLNKIIIIATTAVITAATVITFVLGSKLTDILDSVNKLSQ